MEYTYHLKLVEPGGSGFRDVTGLAQSVTWSGDAKQIARTLSAGLAVPRDGSVEAPNLAEGAALILEQAGKVRFTGQLTQCSTSSQTVVADLSALDGGRFLAGNEGFYRFDNVTPEAAVAAMCRDFGVQTGTLAHTGITVRRKFPGVALDKIVTTLYTLAGEQTGRRYLPRITGDGQLEVVEKPGAASLEIVRTMGMANSWSIERLCKSVAIYTDDGQLVRRVEDGASQALNGRLEHTVIQRSGEDAGAEARAWLEDHGLQQNLTVEVLDPPMELITGAAVLLRDTGSGVSGLFWVDGDTHTWKNGLHLGKFKLNFRNLMTEASAGSEL